MPHTCTDPNCHAPHTQAELDAQFRHHIRKVGWSVIGILGTPSFAYTVGFTARRWPELVYTLDGAGTPVTLGQAQQTLNTVSKQLTDAGARPHHGQVLDVGDDTGRVSRYLLELRMNTGSLVQAKKFFRGKSVSALEVVLVN